MPVQLGEGSTDVCFLCEIKQAARRKHTLCDAVDFSVETGQKQRHACFGVLSGCVQSESLGM